MDLFRSQPGAHAELGDEALPLRGFSGGYRLSEEAEIRVGQVAAREQSVANLLSALEHQHLGDLVPDPEDGVQRRHRLLEDHRHPVAADSVHPGPVLLQEIVGRAALSRTHRPRRDADAFVTPGAGIEDVAKAVPEEVDRDGEDEQRNPRHQDRPRMALKSPGPSDVDEVAQFRQKEVACVESDELEGRENLSYHTKVQRNLNEHWRERVRQDMPEHDPSVRRTRGPCGLDELQLLHGKRLRTNKSSVWRPPQDEKNHIYRQEVPLLQGECDGDGEDEKRD